MLNALRAFARNRGDLVRNLVRFSLLPTTLGSFATWILTSNPAFTAAIIALYAVNLFLAILLYFHPPRRRDHPGQSKAMTGDRPTLPPRQEAKER